MGSILNALTNAKKIKFVLKGVQVTGEDFRSVADKIFGGKVTVTRQPASGGHAAVYNPVNRTLRIFSSSQNFPSDAYEESAIVHEAVHIAGHIHKRKVTPLVEEMAAYAAQGMYLILYESKSGAEETGVKAAAKLPKLLRECKVGGKECDDARLAAAIVVAAELLQKHEPTEAMLDNLQASMKNDSTYKAELARPLRYESGIP